MGENQEQDWLIRDTGNRIRGPFKQAEILQLIKKGQLKGKTELARANSYWFALEEKVEVARFLPEVGGKPPEQPTQMTETLTAAEVGEHMMEATTFTAVPKAAETSEGGIQWLSDEFADEFGSELTGFTISLQTDLSGLQDQPANESPAVATTDRAVSSDEQATLAPTDPERQRQELLQRATVKADTLPSEHKGFHGERPKPIDSLIRGPGRVQPAGQASMVSVPVEDGPAPKMFLDEDETKLRRQSAKLRVWAALIVALALAAALSQLPRKESPEGENGLPQRQRPARTGQAAMEAARQAILLFDLEGARGALSDLELEPNARGQASTYLTQAVLKKEFLFDVEGAMIALQTARSQAKNKRMEAEVDNLMAIYGFSRDPTSSSELLRRNLESYKDEPIFRYNMALALLRTGKAQEAIPLLRSLLASIAADDPLTEDVALAQGWALEAYCRSNARDSLCGRDADAEDSFLRALTGNPHSAKARLGLALFRLRRGGIKASEGDFKAFLDSAPDLDPPARVVNFRKLGDGDFYSFAHSQIVELNTPSPTMSRPSPLIMASDAIISGMQSRTSEAGKILEVALSAAPGDVNVMKALGYLRWKDGQMNELVDVLKETRDRSSFAVNLMLGKAYLKLRRGSMAERHFRALVEAFPNRSEGHSLLGELLSERPEKLEEAKAEFQLALKKDPLDLTALRGLRKVGLAGDLSPRIEKYLPF